MIFIAIDRLIGIVFAEIHDKNKIRMYLAVITIICLLYGLIFYTLIYQTVPLFGDQMITGSFVDLLKVTTVNVLSFIMIALTCIIYLLVGMLIRFKSAGLPSAQSINQRTFRALFCIIAVNIGGYFITYGFVLLIKPSISSPITAWFCQEIIAITLNIGAASNALILYFTSTDYRQAFQKELPFVFKRRITNQTAPIQVLPAISCATTVK